MNAWESCARRANGQSYCWGGSYYGASVVARNETDVYSISLGGSHECLFRRSIDGSTANGIFCSGDNTVGQLGVAAYCYVNSSPPGCTRVPWSPTTKYTQARIDGSFAYNHIGGPVISAGSTTCLRSTDGTLKCWGSNSNGQIGDGTTTNRLVPTSVSMSSLGTPGDVVQVSSGYSHNCALKWDGTVWCWGLSAGPYSAVPAQVAGLAGTVQIAAGDEFTCALNVNGGASCWGSNTYGSLGDCTTDGSDSPVAVDTCYNYQIPGVYGKPEVLVAGSNPSIYLTFELTNLTAQLFQVCGLYKGMPVCWGQTGFAPSPGYYTIPELFPTRAPLHQLSLGYAHACGLQVDGGVDCWGQNANYQRGDTGTNVAFPANSTLVYPGNNDAVAVTAGMYHTCAWLASSGTPYCWGRACTGSSAAELPSQ